MKIYKLIFILFLSFSFQVNAQVKVKPVEFNSSFDDFNSNITKNGKAIFFTSSRSGNGQKIYLVEESIGGWNNVNILKSNINDGKENGAVSITADGQRMYFSSFKHSEESIGRTDIYYAEKVNGEWTNIKNLGNLINSKEWDSQPMISSDGNILFFVSDRPGGFGGTDIYMSFKTAGGWSPAVNAGNTINTQYNEMSPVIGVDNTNFSFSSDRPGGSGGYDIYITKFRNNVFSAASNANSPINSSADEYYYYSMPNSDVAFFTSSRGEGSGGLDIYSAIPNPYGSEAVFLLSGIVKDAQTGSPLGAEIIITDLSSGEQVAELRSDDKTGEYFVVLQQGRTYSITADKTDYLFFSERYEVPRNAKGTSQSKDILLSPISGGNTRLLIFFDFDKSTLQKESIPELERAVAFLRKNSSLKITLEGHTDDVGGEEYNKKLSESRAAAVKDYLVSKQIEAERINTLGYGLSKPLVKEKTDEARAANRRVEMKIRD